MSKFLSKGVFVKPVERSTVQNNWKNRGFTFFENTDPPGHQRIGGIHDADEILTVVTGRLKVLFADQEILCEAGDEIIIPRNEVHDLHNISDAPTHWLCGHKT